MNGRIAVLIGSAILIAATAVAQPDPGRGFRGGPGGGFGMHRADIPTTRIVEILTDKLQLTDEQKPKVAQIIDETKAEMRAQAGAIRSTLEKARDKMAAVLNEDQEQKLQQMKEGLFSGLSGFAAAHGPEIREEVQAAGEEIRLRMALGSLNLSEDQKTKLKDVEKQLRDKTKAIHDEVAPKMEAARKEAKDKIDTILTPEQREQVQKRMKEMPRMGHDRGAGHRFRGGKAGMHNEQNPSQQAKPQQTPIGI